SFTSWPSSASTTGAAGDCWLAAGPASALRASESCERSWMGAGGAGGGAPSGIISAQVSSRASPAQSGEERTSSRASRMRVMDVSKANGKAVGQRLPIGAPGGYHAHQQGGCQNSGEQRPLIGAGQGQRQVESVARLHI